MPVHAFTQPRGDIVHLTIDSAAVRDNLLGDPAARTVAVYLPEAYRRDPTARFPIFVDLASFSNSGLRRLAWTGFGESLPQRLDRLVASGAMGPVIAVFPDCFTSLGGNQYIDSVAMGRWATFLCRELVPRVEAEFRTVRDRHGRALLGKSSGGYGALVHGMRHADVWGAVACHSGDLGFDLVYRADFHRALDVIHRSGGTVESFLARTASAHKFSGPDFQALTLLAMAATYDPDPTAHRGIRLPFDLHTCTLDPAAWQRWLAHDPLHMIDAPTHQQNLRSLLGLYLDVGSRDQYGLHYGARAFVRKLQAASIDHTYEEFPDDHNGTDYRLDVSLPFLYAALARAAQPAA
jgi:S-formylglutathione hydrolase FrmB